MNDQAILCRPGDPRCGKVWDEAGGFEQFIGGPLYIVIGSETTDDKCATLAERFGLEAQALMEYRDAA